MFMFRSSGSANLVCILEEEMATHGSILPGKVHGQRSLGGYSPRGRKELDMTEHSTAVCLHLQPCSRQEAVWAGFQAWGWTWVSSLGVCSGAQAKEVAADPLMVDRQSSRKKM